jgi:hypothetical protein
MKTQPKVLYQDVIITLYRLALLAMVLNVQDAREAQERTKFPPIIGGDGNVYQ